MVVTFDDGYADNAQVAFRSCASSACPATVYLATGFLDGRDLWFDVARRALGEAEREPAKAARTRPDGEKPCSAAW